MQNGMTDEDALFAELEANLDDIVLADVEVVSTMDTATLLVRFAAVERELRERLEMHEARTEPGRELHSARAAMLIELRRRRML